MRKRLHLIIRNAISSNGEFKLVLLMIAEFISCFVSGEGTLPEGICRPPEELAELIEDVIFRIHRGTTPKYKNQVSHVQKLIPHSNGLLLG